MSTYYYTEYNDLIRPSEDHPGFSISEDWVAIRVRGLILNDYYVAPIHLWAKPERQLTTKIFRGKTTTADPVFQASYQVGYETQFDGSLIWTSKRYKLNEDRHNGDAIILIGSSQAHSSPFTLYVEPLTSKKLKRKALVDAGKCPDCEKEGFWRALAMVCEEHGVFL